MKSLYYNFRAFLQNLPLFIRLAWNWRSWDWEHTVEVLRELLKMQAKRERCRKQKVKILTAVKLLEYPDKFFLKNYRKLGEKYNPYYLTRLKGKDGVFTEGGSWPIHLQKLKEYTLTKELAAEEKAHKEAWDYIKKHIRGFWN